MARGYRGNFKWITERIITLADDLNLEEMNKRNEKVDGWDLVVSSGVPVLQVGDGCTSEKTLWKIVLTYLSTGKENGVPDERRK